MTNPTRQFEKHRTQSAVGSTVEIPGHAEAITVSDLSPFGETVTVSWLQPTDKPDKGVVNEFEIRALRTDYSDENPVEIPRTAVSPTVWEPSEASVTTVYWLQ